MYSIRDEYYNLLSNNSLVDTLKLVPELSYSKKYQIINRLLVKYSPKELNVALDEYNNNYIMRNKYNFNYIMNTLENIIKRRSNS